ncbi:hypothetical protein POM88_022293 [Heracleum sosnowskyi]|uniref:Myosin motor domain-containing protein n=1 Tax=Heracleum sosnowskyi TaxID=360622 RepID=A0AAD8MUQ5_9APIA|nr:hypothetical protein POM88_022293 [Heracleum sosnowskyi]
MLLCDCFNEFAKGQEIDSSFLKDEKSRFHLNVTAELLMCDAKSLEDADSADALAKTVYYRLFDWIVEKINRSKQFEQFCINFTNEKLQQHFNQHVFKMEQEEYTKEEIDWSCIEFVDNQDVLDLTEKKPGGIIALLDEAWQALSFSAFSSRIVEVIQILFNWVPFKLQSLMETLSTTEPHYIRCVKPNNVLKPAIFENLNVIQQLRCGMMLEAIRISCAGYPTRRTFYEFLLRFGLLAPEVLEGNYDDKVAC